MRYTEEERRRVKRKFHEILRQCRTVSKPQHCILCDNDMHEVCNSHSVPRFVLRNIAKDGKIYTPIEAAGVPFTDITRGLNNCGTFFYICRDCDSRYFANYETPPALQDPPTNIQMAEIALKNSLVRLYKRSIEMPMNGIIQDQFNFFENKEELDDIQNMDVRDYSFDLRRSKKIIDKNLKSGYRCFYHKVLPYTVPIATQTAITLFKGIDDKTIINDVFTDDPTIRMQDLQLCIFPQQDFSSICLFYHKDDRNVYRFEQQFMHLPDKKRDAYVLYLLIKYSEEFFFSPSIAEEFNENLYIQNLCRENNGYPNLGYVTIDDLKTPPLFTKPEEIPNFLGPEFCL